MEGIKYIPKSQLFDCSVELSSSRKFFVWDGVPENPLLSEETGVLDVAASFDVSSRMERLSYSPSLENIPPKAVVIRPEEKELTQVIFVRSTSAPLKSRVRIECSKAGNYEVLLCSHTAEDRGRSSAEDEHDNPARRQHIQQPPRALVREKFRVSAERFVSC